MYIMPHSAPMIVCGLSKCDIGRLNKSLQVLAVINNAQINKNSILKRKKKRKEKSRTTQSHRYRQCFFFFLSNFLLFFFQEKRDMQTYKSGAQRETSVVSPLPLIHPIHCRSPAHTQTPHLFVLLSYSHLSLSQNKIKKNHNKVTRNFPT